MRDVRIKEFKDNESYLSSQRGSSINTRVWPVYQRRCRDAVNQLMMWWPDDGRILDAGAGDGYAMDIIRKAGFEVTGIDLTQHKVDEAILHNHDMRVGDLSDMPFADSTFDVVYCRHVFEHIIHPKKVMNEFSRVLRSTGRLNMIVPIVEASSVHGKHPQEIPDKEYIAELARYAGFNIERISLENFKFGNEVWLWAKKGDTK